MMDANISLDAAFREQALYKLTDCVKNNNPQMTIKTEDIGPVIPYMPGNRLIGINKNVYSMVYNAVLFDLPLLEGSILQHTFL